MKKKKQWKIQGRFFFINQSHTEGYSYCKLSFSYITKRGGKTNKETTPNPQNAQTNQTNQNKTNRSVFCMKHFCVCNLFIMLNLVKHHKTTYVCFLTISILGGYVQYFLRVLFPCRFIFEIFGDNK